MSDNIPFEIQEEIMKRLPVKSLIQFRSVSKAWKCLIDSSEFITNYHRTQQRHHLLVSYTNLKNRSERKYVSVVDDHTFPQQKFPLTVPSSVNQLTQPTILGSSQGLLCFYDIYAKPDDSGTKTAIIWNPFIRRSFTISLPRDLGFPYSTVVGFGVTPDTCHPKLVKISFDYSLRESGEYGDSDTVVEVFSFSTKSWKRLTTHLPLNSTAFSFNHVAIDRFIYWHAHDLRCDYGRYPVMSFDMITEEFKELDLPDSFARDQSLFLSKVRESLAVVQMHENEVSSVWTMEYGDPKSLKKEFTINTQFNYASVCGFRKSGEPLIEMRVYDPKIGYREHFVYEPYSGHMNSIGIATIGYSCDVTPCIETLLLLDH